MVGRARRRIVVAVAVIVACCMSHVADADFVLFNLEENEAAWRSAIESRGLVAKGGWDFDRDQDYGLQGVDAPLTIKGGGPVSPGIITSENIFIDTTDPDRTFAIAAVGPSEGFGNVANGVVANTFQYALTLNFTDGGKSAVEFDAISLVGQGGTIDLSVNGNFLANVPAPRPGHRWGIMATGEDRIEQIEIFDPDRGFEGVQGVGVTYVPAPTASCAFALLGLVRRRRR